MPKKEWFAEWFDSPYYHLLYNNRDAQEARAFIQKLVGQLALNPGAPVLDLACGKGRHAVTLAELGFKVLGADLAPQSIAAALEFPEQQPELDLDFVVHDMREVIENQQFAAVFNLFTSFGYFDALADNQKVCASIATMLTPNGILVIDFFNAQKVRQNLVAEESVSRGNINFQIKRWADNTHIFKQISIQDPQHDQTIGPFTERVQALSLSDFQELLAASFELMNTYGSYDLAPFDPVNSERLILIAKKKP
jgi:2-polyprenyl-3-methyl-5-hydroxy-6-metoxy-1,4-benzoquinol methylase